MIKPTKYYVSENLFNDLMDIGNIEENSNTAVNLFDLILHLSISNNKISFIVDKQMILDELLDIFMSMLKAFQRKMNYQIDLFFE